MYTTFNTAFTSHRDDDASCSITCGLDKDERVRAIINEDHDASLLRPLVLEEHVGVEDDDEREGRELNRNRIPIEEEVDDLISFGEAHEVEDANKRPHKPETEEAALEARLVMSVDNDARELHRTEERQRRVREREHLRQARS